MAGSTVLTYVPIYYTLVASTPTGSSAWTLPTTSPRCAGRRGRSWPPSTCRPQGCHSCSTGACSGPTRAVGTCSSRGTCWRAGPRRGASPRRTCRSRSSVGRTSPAARCCPRAPSCTPSCRSRCTTCWTRPGTCAPKMRAPPPCRGTASTPSGTRYVQLLLYIR